MSLSRYIFLTDSDLSDCENSSEIRTDLKPNTLYYIIVDGVIGNTTGDYVFEIKDLTKELDNGSGKADGGKIALIIIVIIFLMATMVGHSYIQIFVLKSPKHSL